MTDKTVTQNVTVTQAELLPCPFCDAPAEHHTVMQEGQTTNTTSSDVQKTNIIWAVSVVTMRLRVVINRARTKAHAINANARGLLASSL